MSTGRLVDRVGPARPIVDALARNARRVVFMTGGDARPGLAPE
ncbi:hypothetical protein [Nonomuraea sp. NPDC049480]